MQSVKPVVRLFSPEECAVAAPKLGTSVLDIEIRGFPCFCSSFAGKKPRENILRFKFGLEDTPGVSRQLIAALVCNNFFSI